MTAAAPRLLRDQHEPRRSDVDVRPAPASAVLKTCGVAFAVAAGFTLGLVTPSSAEELDGPCPGYADGALDLGCATVDVDAPRAGDATGAAIADIEGCGVCRALDIRRGDVVTDVGGFPVDSGAAGAADEAGALEASWAVANALAAEKHRFGQPIRISIVRDGRPGVLTLAAPWSPR